MKEIGIDVDNQLSKKLTKNMSESVDKIIVIGEKNLPDYLLDNNKIEYWDIEYHTGTNLNFHRKTRDHIINKVKN